MQKHTTLLILFLSISSLTAQITFERSYLGAGTTHAADVCQTGDGGFIVTAFNESLSDGNEDIVVMKTDEYGDPLWVSNFGYTGDDRPEDIILTEDGGCIVAGYITDEEAGTRDILLLKLDPIGKEEWRKVNGWPDTHEFCKAFAQTADGGFVLAGHSNCFSKTNYDGFILCTTPKGRELWHSTFGSDFWTFFQDIIRTRDGGYLMTGGRMKSNMEQSCDLFLLKADAGGKEVWSKIFGGAKYDGGMSLVELDDGGFFIAGVTLSFGSGDADIYLIRTDSTGAEMWSTTSGVPNIDDVIYSLVRTPDNAVAATGRTGQPKLGESSCAFLAKFDLDGHELWKQTFHGEKNAQGYDLSATLDGGFILCGDSFAQADNETSTLYLIKTNADGEIITSVEKPKNGVSPHCVQLYQNYPNPFNPQTTIRFDLPKAGHATLEIYNMHGQVVQTLVQGAQHAGVHAVVWDGRDQNGEAASSGVYLYRLVVDDNFIETKRMILLR